MDIASLSAAVAANLANSRARTQGNADPTAQAVQKPDARVEKQRDSVSVELSSVGKLKSSLSEAQAASRTLGDTKQPASDADVTKAATNFVRAFNSATRTARSTAAGQGTLAENNQTRAAEGDLRRAISSDPTAASGLNQIGITQQGDGTLAIDTNKFNAALKANPDAARSALSAVGQQVDRTVTRELANSGNIGRPVNLLDNRARSPESQQAEQQALAAAAQQTQQSGAQTTSLNNSLTAVTNGAAAYQRIFSI